MQTILIKKELLDFIKIHNSIDTGNETYYHNPLWYKEINEKDGMVTANVYSKDEMKKKGIILND